MIAAVIKSSLVLLMTLGIAQTSRRRSAAVRHLIWTMGLIAALAVPLLSPLLPSWNAETRGLTPGFLIVPEIESAGVTRVPANSPITPPKPRNVLFAIWLSGFAIVEIFLIGSGLKLGWLAFQGKPVTSDRWLNAVHDVARALKLNRPIRLLQNCELSLLGTWGVLRGRILLPRDAESWSDERVRVVLGHELAHIKRFDWLVQIIAETARAIYWFNPLFWLACKRLRQESEHACDDAVLNLGIDGQTYAAHLLELARALKHSDRAWSAVLAMAQTPHLERRFVAMLNPSLDHKPATTVTLLLIALAATCLTLPLAAMQSRSETLPPIPIPSIPQATAAVAPEAAVVANPAVVAANIRAKTARTTTRQPVQEPSGALGGNVSDPSGALIPGARVALSNLDAKSRQEVIAGETGSFEFSKLPTGRYVFEVQVPGFQPFHSRVIEIQNSQRIQQDVTLTVGSISERVEVVTVGTPKPAPNPAGPRRIRVGGNIQVSRLTYQVKPIYPQSARDAGVEGTVRLQGIIGTDGSILALGILNEGATDPELANAARGAVSQWRYRPTLLNGAPVEVSTTIEVVFKLTQ